jgi:hypothetical protein
LLCFLQYPLLSNSPPQQWKFHPIISFNPSQQMICTCEPNQFNGEVLCYSFNLWLMMVVMYALESSYILLPTSNWIQIFFSRSSQNASHNKWCVCVMHCGLAILH